MPTRSIAIAEFVCTALVERVKAPLCSDVERSERGVAQKVRVSLAGEQKLDICDQSVAVCAALRCVCCAQRRNIKEVLERETKTSAVWH